MLRHFLYLGYKIYPAPGLRPYYTAPAFQGI